MNISFMMSPAERERRIADKVFLSGGIVRKCFNCLWCVAVLSVCCAGSAYAVHLNDQWSADAELRLRYEVWDGFNAKQYGDAVTVGSPNDRFLLSRIRIGTTWKPVTNILVRIAMQDARAPGWNFSDSDWYSKEFGMQNNPQKDCFELYRAYLEVSGPAGLPLTMTLGRQGIAYGDQRVFGPGEWGNSGKWIWDAAKVSFTRKKHFLDLFYGKTMLHDPDQFSLSHRWGYDGFGAYGHIAWDSGAFEPIFVCKKNRDGGQKYNDLTHYYWGFRIYDDDVYGCFYNATVMKETGHETALSGVRSDVDALGWHLDAGRKFGKVKLGAGYTYASGDDPATADIERFDGVFGATDKYYGRMNLFSWSNLKDAELFAEVPLLDKLKIRLELHRFWLADTGDGWRTYKNTAGSSAGCLGDEVDICALYKYSRALEFQAGYGHFRPGGFMDANVPSAVPANWLFLQTTFRF